MKKQFLLFALLVMATFATTSVFGQLSTGITATQPITPLVCESKADFLHPLAGRPYTYQMDGTTGAEDVVQWQWFATKNPAFITGGALASDSLKEGVVGQILSAGANYGKLSNSNSVSITWTPTLLVNTEYQGAASTTVFPSPTFVVGYGKGTNCADNIKVYEINPILNFAVDIANIDTVAVTKTLAWDAPTAQCVDNIRSASYVSATNDLLMNYGKDVLYFEVAAANFNKDFTPTFRLVSGLNGPQTAVISLHTSLANAQAGTLVSAGAKTTWTAASVGSDWATGIQFTATNPNDVARGVSLFVKVVITNSTYESLAANPFVLAVDAQDNFGGAIRYWDMEDADCTTLANAADQIDQATHTVNPRPTITGVDDSATNNAEPNNIVPKNP